MRFLQNIVCLMLIVAVAGNAAADEKKKKGKRRDRTPKVTQRFVAKMELSDDQKTKVAEIDKKFADKAKELAKQKAGILSKEQLTAQRAAQKAAKEAKKKPADARKAGMEALKMTDEQKEKMKAHAAATQAMNKEVIAALKKVLTEEQQAKLPRAGGRRGGDKKGKGKKKKDAA